MIKRFVVGNPIDTESVVKQLQVSAEAMPYCSLDEKNNSISFTMTKYDLVYGLGETSRGMNKRGWLYVSNNSDQPNHEENTHSLYASQNFFILTNKDRTFGVYIDTPGIVRFDIGYTCLEEMRITLDDFDANIYFVEGESALSIVHEFRELIGKSYIPPKWAFGYGQSRWGYKCQQDIEDVQSGYEKAGIPLDMIYMDIDYMERFKDFTIDEKAFPKFPEFVKSMKNKGIRLIPIIDAGVKIEDGYPVYEEGVEKDFFCKKDNGENLVAAVWPGKVHFPDFLRPDVRKWFGDKYRFLLDMGIEGFWNDMNEPAIFYTEDHLKEVFEKIRGYEGKNLDIQSYFEFTSLVSSISNNKEDYERFYHEYHGQKIRHDKVHNIYGFNMTKAAGEAFKRYNPDKRYLMFSRSSYIGMHRYGGIWTGDNKAWWSHMLLCIQQMPALNMCGFLYSGSDVGGFGADTTEDLVMRWTELGLFTPLFRNHAALGTRDQELYRFEHIEDFKNIVKLRYAFLPYIYSQYMKAAENDTMYFMPLAFLFTNDDRARRVEDQLFIGEGVMIAPVYQQNAEGRYVYLPEDMKLIRFRSYDDFDEEVLEKGDHYVSCALNEILVFIRKGYELPIATPGRNVEDTDITKVTYLKF